ncbi:MAG: hypothetical protein U0U67_14110 [Chitinophagales bacterium]
MNNTNRILLSVFLLLGTIFFSVFLYYIFKEEGLSYKVTTNVSLANARILKNDYFNQQKADSLKLISESERYDVRIKRSTNAFTLLCMQDQLVYAKTNYFDINEIEAPETIQFSDIAIIPSSVLKQDFKLQLMDKNKSIVEFNTFNLYNSLNLEDKNDNLSDQKEIKLESIDKKIILYLVFDLNVSVR